jgi:pantetheine-phosphate adenylyltransferase
MAKCIFAGSFDPITLGHKNVIERLSGFFEGVTVLVLNNINKKTALTIEDRLELCTLALKDLKKVRVDLHTGLLGDYCAKSGIFTVVRGVRNVLDFEYEGNLAENNKVLNGKIETIFMLPDAPLRHISSTVVKELLYYGADISGYVPSEIVSRVTKLIKNPNKN